MSGITRMSCLHVVSSHPPKMNLPPAALNALHRAGDTNPIENAQQQRGYALVSEAAEKLVHTRGAPH